MLKLYRFVTVTLLAGMSALSLAEPTITVYKDPNCGCCAAWIDHLKANGFKAQVHDVRDMTPHKKKLRVPERLASCHTAVIEGYTIEGHVPASQIRRLLAERPKARGLAVPDMPQGSPGMETGKLDPYDVLLFTDSGSSRVYSSFGR
ncbi:MAG: DUF411 domain-containing protein [Pseudomonadota bacterium]